MAAHILDEKRLDLLSNDSFSVMTPKIVTPSKRD